VVGWEKVYFLVAGAFPPYRAATIPDWDVYYIITSRHVTTSLPQEYCGGTHSGPYAHRSNKDLATSSLELV